MATSEHMMPETHATSFALPFDTDVPRLASRGINWSFGLLMARYVLSVGSTAVLSRLISPADYGLLGMVATFTVLVQAFSDFGLSWATVQRKELTRSQIDALFLINTGFGFLLMSLCIIAAPHVATFYHRPELTKITIAASVSLFFSAMAVQPTALMRRQMRLKELSLCNLWALMISAVITVFLALQGFGYWALVVQLVLVQMITTALSFTYSNYYPRFPQSLANLRSLLLFGGYSAAYGLINYFARNFDNVLIGKVWGATDLGFYTRAYFLMMLPGMMVIGVFGGVLIPAMASLRNDPERMEGAYLRAMRVVAMIGCSFSVGLALAAPELVDLVYGPKWQAVVPILLWLSIAGILQPLQNTASWLYIVTEKGRGLFVMGLVVSVSAVCAFVIGLPGGPVGVARAYAIANTLIAYPILLMAHRAAGLNMKRTVVECTPLIAAAVIMGLVVWSVGQVTATARVQPHGRLALKVTAGAFSYLVCLRRLSPATCSELSAFFNKS